MLSEVAHEIETKTASDWSNITQEGCQDKLLLKISFILFWYLQTLLYHNSNHLQLRKRLHIISKETVECVKQPSHAQPITDDDDDVEYDVEDDDDEHDNEDYDSPSFHE